MTKQVFWHDGTLDSIRLQGPTRRRLGSIELDLSLYPTNKSSNRSAFTLVCTSALTVSIVGNMQELQDNAGAGNIEDAVIHPSGEGAEIDLRLVGGGIRIQARTIRLRKRAA